MITPFNLSLDKEVMVLLPFAVAPYRKPIRYHQQWWKRYCYPYMQGWTYPERKSRPSLDELVAVFKADLPACDYQYIKDEFISYPRMTI